MKLAAELAKLGLKQPVVLALPRGGVPVAAEIAKVLDAPLELLVVRKVGAPGNPQLAVAAIVDGEPPDVIINREIAEAYCLDDDELRSLVQQELPELERRRQVYKTERKPDSLAGKTIILVDDGVATGTTMKVALRALKRRGPKEVILAIPVAPPDVIAELRQEADQLVCISQPMRFRALGYHYVSFPQITDEEVIETLKMTEEASTVRALQAGRRTAF